MVVEKEYSSHFTPSMVCERPVGWKFVSIFGICTPCGACGALVMICTVFCAGCTTAK